jgi:ABC-type nitrate/sulfonate/bicarbonate transport system substrate-binding protein/outer membrane protein OmpA-like peptidoglycan-associated protein
MTRIKWGRIFTALLILVLFVYGGALLLGVARPDELPGISAFPELRDAIRRNLPQPNGPQAQPGLPTLPAQPTQPPSQPPAPTSPPAQPAQPTAAPTPAPAQPTQAPVRPTQAPTAAPAQPTRPPAQQVQDAGFRSEVPVPESQGSFRLGYVTVAFDKEFPPYAPVVLLFQEKLAEKRGLGVRFVPFDIEDKNRIAEFRRAELLQSGGFDMILTTMSTYALWGGPGVGKVTALVGESAGADKAVVQASSVQTFNDMAGKAFAYSDSSVSEYLLYYMLRVGGVPVGSVTRFGQENLNQAARRYLNREAHGVVGWTSGDMEAAAARDDSRLLMTSDQFRVTMDVVVTGTRALETKREAVQAFHDAWFEANKLVFERPEQAAASISRWSAPWTGVGSTKDLTDALGEFAQATLADNAAVMSDQNLPLLYQRYKESQVVWASGGREVRQPLPDQQLPTVFEPAFVRRSAGDQSLVSNRPPVNPTFHLTARPQITGLSAEQQSRLTTVAVLGVREVQFEPGSTTLSPAALQAIEESVIPVLRSTVGTYLRIEGSAGWPAGAGLNEGAVNALAFERARAVQDYIIKFGIPIERIVLSSTLPRCRECADPEEVARDNRVTFSLVTG